MNGNSLSITGGQKAFPLAVVETDKTMEISVTSSKFTLDMFEMANATQPEEGTRVIRDCGFYEVKAGSTITIPHFVDVDSIRIDGFTKGEDAAAGVFAAEATGTTTTITFNTGDVAVGETIMVSFKREIAESPGVAIKTNTPSSKGELWMYFPIYSDGADCTEATVLGRAGVHIYRVRATQAPGFDASYKTASTNTVTFSAMDAKRADNKMYEVFVEKYDESGAEIPSTGA